MSKVIFLAILLCAISLSFSKEYYVSSSGDDSNLGTEASPWKTLKKVSDFSFATSDDVYLKRGETFAGDLLIIHWNGTVNDPAIIGAYGIGNRPIVSFASPEKENHYGIYTSAACKHVVVENIEVTNAGLALKGAGSKDYTVRNVKVTNSREVGIFLQQVDGYLVENCEVYKAGNCGVAVWGSPEPIAKNGIIRNNKVSHLKSNDGIVLHQDGSGGDVGSNHLIIDNISHNNPEQGYDITAGSYVLLRGNVSYDNKGGSVTIGHSGHHILIDKHSSKHEGNWTIAIGMGGDYSRYLTVRRSLIVNPTTYGIRMQGKTKYAAIANNTIVYGGKLEQNRPMIAMQGDFTDVTAKNNILISTNNTPESYVGYLNGQNVENTNSDFDYNYYYRPDQEQKLFSGQTFGNWQSSLKQDINGKYTSPLLTNPSAGDYTLSANSPCIDAGGPLTTTIKSGSGTEVPVKIAYFFFDGFNLTIGDTIIIGNNEHVIVKKVDYENNILTIDRSINWNAGDGVWLPYNGAAPDIGFYESGGSVGNISDVDNKKGLSVNSNILVLSGLLNNTIVISYNMAIAKMVTVSIYDIKGKLVKQQFSGYKNSGNHKFLWNIEKSIVSGLYFVNIKMGDRIESRMVSLVK